MNPLTRACGATSPSKWASGTGCQPVSAVAATARRASCPSHWLGLGPLSSASVAQRAMEGSRASEGEVTEVAAGGASYSQRTCVGRRAGMCRNSSAGQPSTMT